MHWYGASTSPIGTLVVLAYVTYGVQMRAWTFVGPTYSYKIPVSKRPTEVRFNGALLTLAVGSVETTPSSWDWDGTYLVVRPPSGQSIWAGAVQALFQLTFCSPTTWHVNNALFEPRIKSLPTITERIEAYFGGIGQIGGGSLTLVNTDGFFDGMEDYQWDAGTVTILLGMDIPNAHLTSGSDFIQIGVWGIDQWSRTREEFTLRLIELKGRAQAKLPLNTFDLATFPNAGSGVIGKPVPLAYGRIVGATPMLVDAAARTFKVADHAVTSFDGLRMLLQDEQEFSTNSYTAYLWSASGTRPIYRTYLPGVTVKSISYLGGAGFTESSSLTDMATAIDAWHYEDGWLYYTAHTTTDGGIPANYRVTYSQQTENWVPIRFASTDLSTGTFVPDSSYSADASIAVDFTGKPGSDGKPITSAPDVINDILTTAGETSIYAAAFTEANRRLLRGYELRRPVYRRALGIHLTEQKDLSQIISDLCTVCGCYVYTDSVGRWSIGVFDPLRSGPAVDESNVLTYSESNDTTTKLSMISGGFRRSEAEDISQPYQFQRAGTQYLAKQSAPLPETRDLPFWDEADAIEFAQQITLMRRKPLRKFSVTTKWYPGWLVPGSALGVSLPSRGISGVYEVVEQRLDVNRAETQYTLGDQRAIGYTAAWWQPDTPTIPSLFANLAGYGTGAATWNPAWDPQIKAWAKANLSYWTDDNGYVDSSDPDSFMISTWN